MDGIGKLEGVVVIGATNRPDILDPALLRPGRFDRLVYVGPPDERARLEILKIHTRNTPLAKDVSLKDIARVTDGYSGSDIETLVREAAMIALRESIDANKVYMRHFSEALKRVGPSITEDMVRYYRSWSEKARSLRERRTLKVSYFA